MIFQHLSRVPRPFARDPFREPKAGDVIRFNAKVVRTVVEIDGNMVRYRGAQGGMGAMSITAWRLATRAPGVQIVIG